MVKSVDTQDLVYFFMFLMIKSAVLGVNSSLLIAQLLKEVSYKK